MIREAMIIRSYRSTVVIHLLTSISVCVAYFGLTAGRVRHPVLPLSLSDLIRVQDVSSDQHKPRDKFQPSKLCDVFKLQRKQKRMCKKGRGVPEVLLEATKLAVGECQAQFRNERWNCSIGKYRHNILKRGFKETSFLYAISSAGLVHAFARACSRGTLDRCTCDESKKLRDREAWLWGGCGDNIRFGVRFTRRFLRRTNKAGLDLRAKIDKHNSMVGRKVVRKQVRETCKCHGVSGACTVKTCWRQLARFREVGRILKQKYEMSSRVISLTNQATGRLQLVLSHQMLSNRTRSNLSKKPRRLYPKTGELVYLDKSPDFCRPSAFSKGTTGRICIKNGNCDTLCCGRGHNLRIADVKHACRCHVTWCCYVTCEQCVEKKEQYTCK